jgi:hypothetical protein
VAIDAVAVPPLINFKIPNRLVSELVGVSLPTVQPAPCENTMFIGPWATLSEYVRASKSSNNVPVPSVGLNAGAVGAEDAHALPVEVKTLPEDPGATTLATPPELETKAPAVVGRVTVPVKVGDARGAFNPSAVFKSVCELSVPVMLPHAVEPDAAAQVPSPLQNVEELADVPLFKLVTGKLPVTPPAEEDARLMAGMSALTKLLNVGAAAAPVVGPPRTLFAA